MKLVVVGGTGRIGDKVMTALDDAGHKAVAASPAFGIDAFTGEGLDEAMAGADVVIDVSNAPASGNDYLLKFFSTVTRNVLKAGRRAGVQHHVALSVLGCDRLPESGYMRAKVAQEELIREARVPHTLVRSTQFMEFLERVAKEVTADGVARVPDAKLQPIAAVEVAELLASLATGPAANDVVEIAGPEILAFADTITCMLAARHDHRRVVADPEARYFGAGLTGDVLLPGSGARIASIRLADWLSHHRRAATTGEDWVSDSGPIRTRVSSWPSRLRA